MRLFCCCVPFLANFLRKDVIMKRIKSEFTEFKLLLKCVPTGITVLFVASVVCMNLLANKSINLPIDWLALDCGIIVSWFAFLAMDIITKHFGPKASTEISIFAMLINLICCLIFFIGSVIPGAWGESYVEGSQNVINGALNNTFGGTWYVLLGSATAFVASSVINNFSNWGIGKLFKKKPDCFGAYVMRAYVSTAIAQFADNLLFAFIVSYNFFEDWTPLKCVTCALTGMVVELLCEVVFSGLGFYVCKKWKKEGVGQEYFEFVEAKNLQKTQQVIEQQETK